MTGRTHLAFRAVLEGTTTRALEPLLHDVQWDTGRLRVNVLFTNQAGTVGALRMAGALTKELPAKIVLFVPLVVPFPLPLDEPPVPLSFACRRITELLRVAPVEASVEAYVLLCRNPIEAVLATLRPHSLALMGRRGRWFFNKTNRFAGKLRAAGHEVLLSN